MPRLRNSVSVIAAAALLAAGLAVAIRAQAIDPGLFNQFRYRFIGPVGNRVDSVAGVAGDPLVYYAGAASGGIFKTADGGTTWKPIFDGQPVSSVGSLAVAPSDPNIVWAGTGEACIRSNISVGNGIYKSTDAGRTWSHMGLELTGRLGRVVVDPHNPDIALACALGHSYGPQPERGVFRTSDGGRTWQRVLFVDQNTGCSDLAMDPNNPRILFAGMWQLEIKTWGVESGGPGSGLFKSTDGGQTWTRLTGNGLPRLPVGKIAVAVAPSNANRVYALIETGDGVPWNGKETESGQLWRSDDGGGTWRVVNHDRDLAARTHYYSHVAVAPDNENEVYFMSGSFIVSLDGGVTDTTTPGLHDNHALWVDPKDPSRMIEGNDNGVHISVNRTKTWEHIGLPIAQMYHVYADNQIPYNVYGNRQDGPSARGPSNSRLSGRVIPRDMWHGVAGGESGFAMPDPVDSNIVWATSSGIGTVGGIVARYDERSRQYRHVEIWPDFIVGWPPADLKYRFNWTFPLAISPHDHNQVYAGSQYVHTTTDGGQSWQVISPDLTTNDKSHQQASGGLTPENIGIHYFSVVFAIAESPREKGVIWAGTNDGLVQVTRDGGKSWTNVTANIPNLPRWGTVSNIEPSRYQAGSAYLTIDFHQVNNRDPYVYKTTDYGRTWTAITAGIPKSMLSYAHCIREDPVRKGLLYLGTENAVYASVDDGANWLPLQANLPHAPAHWLVVQEHFNDLVIATYGRGFWILDDITPLQQLTPRVLDTTAHLFTPRPAYRFRPITAPMSQVSDPSEGENPPYGASINYYLKTDPKGDVRIRILDGKGETVKTLRAPKRPGINRVWWDLRYEPVGEIRLRMSPPYAPWVPVGPEGWRPVPEYNPLAILAPPGTYTVKLTVDGQELSEPLVVRKDPHSGGTEADLQTQFAMLSDLRRDFETLSGMVNRIEVIRTELDHLAPFLKGDEKLAAVRTAAEGLDTKFVDLEEHLIQRKMTGHGTDRNRWPAQLDRKLKHLADGVAISDFPPTTQQKEVHALLRQQVETYRAQFDTLVRQDLAAFNTLLRERQIGHIIATIW